MLFLYTLRPPYSSRYPDTGCIMLTLPNLLCLHHPLPEAWSRSFLVITPTTSFSPLTTLRCLRPIAVKREWALEALHSLRTLSGARFMQA